MLWDAEVAGMGGDELEAYQRRFAHRFELLGIVYRAYASIPASSAGSESLFSRAGIVASMKRSSLAAQQIASQTTIRDNWHESMLDVTGYSTERKKQEKEAESGKGQGKGAESEKGGSEGAESGKGDGGGGARGGTPWTFTPVVYQLQAKKMVFTTERGHFGEAVEDDEIPNFLEGLFIGADDGMLGGFDGLHIDGGDEYDFQGMESLQTEPAVVQLQAFV